MVKLRTNAVEAIHETSNEDNENASSRPQPEEKSYSSIQAPLDKNDESSLPSRMQVGRSAEAASQEDTILSKENKSRLIGYLRESVIPTARRESLTS